ncbi:anhydro-N-acetylmuramic acid kinase [Stenotrophomonas sp. C3(2023)]|uniref:anhydro-N-acetylmuramic acid kinase n=1 Tax=Stenotrophomonas sp. C3(2023) TaxID=3080277 RepID=UPI00293CCFEF|nr:anhydro-N-acetylmuramic acid kinase [Stenotrophomonas sp. C3(2023)]MDV3467487.1 anhydro-N-acetylmuramic acid kinase [Stenotrophomonas sp. C3(2023)]
MAAAPRHPEPEDGLLYLGLMSGTSADGIDAALVRFPAAGGCRFVAGLTHAWEPTLQQRLIALGQGADLASLDELGDLDARIGLAFAEAALRLLDDAGVTSDQVRAIGSHGQTVRHRPMADPAFTLQLGDANRIAERTGITTVADFRRRDVAAGGQGAPLMPAFHLAMLGTAAQDRAILNLGGIGNLSLVRHDGSILGFDTGPANALLDGWCQRHTGRPYDHDGGFAAAGTVLPALLQRWLDDPWFALPPPKSTGREQFHMDWVDAAVAGMPHAPADVQATLLELTAATVAEALLRHQPGTAEVLVCGGGVRNGQLMACLQAHLPKMSVVSSARHGLDPDYMEAMGFAWLARQTLEGLAGNLPSVTGASGPRVLGAIHPGR